MFRTRDGIEQRQMSAPRVPGDEPALMPEVAAQLVEVGDQPLDRERPR